MTTPQAPVTTSDLVVRLTRLEERMQQVVTAIEKLAKRDAEFEDALRAMSDRFNITMSAQAEAFCNSLLRTTVTAAAVRVEPVFRRRSLIIFLRQLFVYG
jgi:hypothetical protein